MSAYIPPFVEGYSMSGQSRMGGEYLNIAEAILEGRGYSDPFGDETGPTGWSPPVLTYSMAACLYLVDGSRDKLVICFLSMQAFVLAFTATVLFYIVSSLRQTRLAVLAMAIVVIPNFKWMFQLTHDCVFQMFWIDLIVLGLWTWRVPPIQTWKKIAWGLLGGICALSSPIVGFAWASTTVATWRLTNWKAICLVATTSVLIVTPWVLYQSNRLGKFTPIKSNASFEQFQGQLVLPDGLVVEESYRLHPYGPKSVEGKRYREIGETEYLSEKRQEFRAAVSETPREYARKSIYRVLAATVWLESEIPSNSEKPSFMLLRLLAVLPFVGLIFIVFPRAESANWALPAAFCFAFYLVPYVFVAYYERYAVPLTLPRMIFTFWLLYSVKDYLKGKRCVPSTNTE